MDKLLGGQSKIFFPPKKYFFFWFYKGCIQSVNILPGTAQRVCVGVCKPILVSSLSQVEQ